MTTPTITDYLKYANLQMAAEAFIRDEKTDVLAASDDVERPVRHGVEAVADLTLGHDDLAGCDRYLCGRSRHRLELHRRHRRERRELTPEGDCHDGNVGRSTC